MEQSPLIQQTKPEVLKAKVVDLYESLFQDELFEPTEGFWSELFLLKPAPSSLRNIVGSISASDLLHHHEVATQELFHRAVQHVRTSKPATIAIALDTLTAFLEAVLSKRYSSPSSDIIAVLAGLEDVDFVLTEFVVGLDEVIRDGDTVSIRQKAVKVANAAVSGAYQTGLISYFLNRDLFPSIVKLLQELEDPLQGTDAFALLGLLSNYNKFEFANPYRLRLEDSVSEAAIKAIINCVGSSTTSCRNSYLAVQDDQPDSWSPLSLLGLGAFSVRTHTAPALSEEEVKRAFAALPPPEIVVLLSTYESAVANPLVAISLITSKADPGQTESPFSSFLSLSSYLIQNAYKSIRASAYSCLCLLVLQVCLEEQTTAKAICASDHKTTVRLCRQRTPHLPVYKGDRPIAAIILDVVIGGLGHNLRLKLDIELYDLLFTVLLRLLTTLSQTRTRLACHWTELWRTLLSFLRFLTTYPAELSALPSIHLAVDGLLNVLAFSISAGESFLPDAASYDDLFYKVVEAAASSDGKADLFTVLQKHFVTSSRPAADAAFTTLAKLNSHYRAMLDEQKGRRKSLVSGDVSKIIKQGYETLDIPPAEAWGRWDKYREVERKMLLKRAARIAVGDVRGMLAKQG